MDWIFGIQSINRWGTDDNDGWSGRCSSGRFIARVDRHFAGKDTVGCAWCTDVRFASRFVGGFSSGSGGDRRWRLFIFCNFFDFIGTDRLDETFQFFFFFLFFFGFDRNFHSRFLALPSAAASVFGRRNGINDAIGAIHATPIRWRRRF